MPFTPFHLGPACAVKVLAGGSLGITIFSFAQIAMDIEPLVHLLRGEGITHGVSHTLLGATVIALLTILIGRPFCQLLLKLWPPPATDESFMKWLRGPQRITWLCATGSAFLGTYSHVLLDSMIHTDVHPFAPFVESNPMLGLVSFGAMHLVCLGIGLLGLMGMFVIYAVESRTR